MKDPSQGNERSCSAPRKAPREAGSLSRLSLARPSSSLCPALQLRQGPQHNLRPLDSPSDVQLPKETKRPDTSRGPGSIRQPKADSRAGPPSRISTGGLQVGTHFLVHHLLFQDEKARISRAPERGFKIIWEEKQGKNPQRQR